MERNRDCPVCSSTADEPFARFGDQPVHCNLLWDSAEAARAARRGDIELSFCGSCGHVFNAAFDPELTEYGGTYENSLHHSGVFQEYASDLVDELVERHAIYDRDIVEIGAGQGDFLQMLCRTGGSRGVGFDPSYVAASRLGPDVAVVPDFYGPEHASRPADVVVCRHVLEHVATSGSFLHMLREVIGGRDALLFFEVPNALWTLEQGGIWDVIYEHCGYFTPTSLRTAFELAGFAVSRLDVRFGGQFLTVEARPGGSVGRSDSPEIDRLTGEVERFAGTRESILARWQERLGRVTEECGSAAVWGGGSKGVTFLNTVGHASVVETVVDENRRKQGRFVPGTAQRIVAPEDLLDIRPDVVIVMNPNYREEIRTRLDRLGLEAETVVA